LKHRRAKQYAPQSGGSSQLRRADEGVWVFATPLCGVAKTQATQVPPTHRVASTKSKQRDGSLQLCRAEQSYYGKKAAHLEWYANNREQISIKGVSFKLVENMKIL